MSERKSKKIPPRKNILKFAKIPVDINPQHTAICCTVAFMGTTGRVSRAKSFFRERKQTEAKRAVVSGCPLRNANQVLCKQS